MPPTDNIQSLTPLVLALLCVVVAVLVVVVLGLSARVGRQARMLRSVLSGPNGEDLEGMLKNCLRQSESAVQRGDELESRIDALSGIITGCVQRVGLVRFDAYGDVSGRQSFSLALLDGHGDGAILTGLFGRTDGRCFGKAVVDGQTEQALSEEEEEALQSAMEGRAPAQLEKPERSGRGERNARSERQSTRNR